MEEMKKEIESLKKKTFYLLALIISVTVSLLVLNIGQVRQYSTIQDYYFDSLSLDRELNQALQEQNEYLREVLSAMN